MDVGAMLAYYTVLALFPMLVFIGSLALLVLPSDTVRQGVAMASEALPLGVRDILTTRIEALLHTATAGFAIGGAALALWGASRGAVSLTTALNAMFGKKETRAWWHRQLIAIVVTVGVAAMVVVALALLVVGPIVGDYIAGRFGLADAFNTAWAVGRWIGAGVLVMIVWAVAYKFLPDTNAPFRIFTPGAFVGVAAWLGISALFGVYLSHFNSYEATYGALGTAIAFLTWLWLSNMALLFGAQVNDALADVRAQKSAAAAQLADPHEHAHAV